MERAQREQLRGLTRPVGALQVDAATLAEVRVRDGCPVGRPDRGAPAIEGQARRSLPLRVMYPQVGRLIVAFGGGHGHQSPVWREPRVFERSLLADHEPLSAVGVNEHEGVAVGTGHVRERSVA